MLFHPHAVAVHRLGQRNQVHPVHPGGGRRVAHQLLPQLDPVQAAVGEHHHGDRRAQGRGDPHLGRGHREAAVADQGDHRPVRRVSFAAIATGTPTPIAESPLVIITKRGSAACHACPAMILCEPTSVVTIVSAGAASLAMVTTSAVVVVHDLIGSEAVRKDVLSRASRADYVLAVCLRIWTAR